MSWPPPTVLSAPSSMDAAPLQRPDDDDWRGTARPVAAWLAATGGALVLVAAIVVVAGSWHDIAPAWKFAGLVFVSVVLAVAAEWARSSVPSTARAVAHLAAALAAPVGIAMAAVGGATWPACVVAGGVMAAVACDVQALRWRAPLLDTAAVAAVGMGVVGLAAIVAVPVGVLAAITASVLLAVRREAGAVTMALAAAASPILVALAEQRIGPGTLARIGATGDVLAWGAPVAGMLAGGVLAVVAARRTSPSLAVAAIGTPAIGVAMGMATIGAEDVVWLCVPGVILLTLEAVVALARSEPWRGVATPLADATAFVGSTLAIALPGLVAVGHAVSGDVTIVPLLVGTSALAASAIRTGRAHDAVSAVPIAGTGSAAIAISAAAGWPLIATAASAVAVAGVTTLAATTRRWQLVVPAMGWSVGFLLAGNAANEPVWIAATVGVALLVLGLGLATAHRPVSTALDVPVTLATFAGAALVASCVDGHRAAAFVVALGVAIVVVAARTPIQAPALLLAVTCSAALASVAVLGDSVGRPIDTWLGAGVLALAIAAAVTWWRSQELWTCHLATVLTVAAAPFGLTAIGASGAEIVIALLVVAVVLTGTSFLVVSSGPMASAGVAASALAAGLAVAAAPVLTSVAVTLLGVQLALEGSVRGSTDLTRAGAGAAAVGAASTWWTSGANEAVLEWLRPYGVTSGDLATATISVLLLTTGFVAGRMRPLTSWVTVAPGLGLAAVSLLDAQLGRDVEWSVPLTLALGVVAVAVGGWRRLAAPMILGTATVGATVVVSAGPRLAELDSWMWLAIGGVGLILVAVLVERAVSGDRATLDWHRLRATWR